MAADGSIVIEVELDDGRVVRGLANIDDQFDQTQRSGDSAFKKLGSSVKVFAVAAGAAALAAVGLGAAIGAVVESSAELNADLARLRANADTAGLGFDALSQEVAKVGAVSGELDSAVETVSNLIQTDFSQNQIGEALDYINGAAIRFSDTLNTEGIADGLQETFATGEAIGQFGELLERSGLDLEVFNAGLAQAEANGTATNFVLETLASTGLGDTYQAYLEGNKAITDYNQAQVENEILTAQLAERLTPLATQFTELKNTIIEVVLGTQPLGAVFELLGNNIANFLSNLTGLDVSVFLAAFEQIRVTVETALNFIVDTSQVALEYLRSLWAENGDEISTSASNAFEAIRSVIEDVLNAVVPFVLEQVDKIREFWAENGEQILEAATNAFNGIKAVIDFVMPAILFVIEYVWNAIQSVVTGALGLITGSVQIFSGLLTGDFTKLWEGIVTVFKGAFDLILGILSLTFIGGIRTALTNLSKTAIQIVKTKWENIVATFKSFGPQAAATVSKLAKDAIGFFKSLFTQGVAAVRSLQTGVTTQVTTLANNLVNAIKDVPAKFTQFGKDIINGLIDGIEGLSDKAIGAITGVVDSVVNKAKELLGINSPSKVFIEIGNDTDRGLEEGIKKNAKKPLTAIEDVTNNVIAMANPLRNPLRNTSLSLNGTASSAANINTTNNVFNNNTGNSQQNVNIAPADVILDNVKVGSIIYKEVDKNQYRSAAISAYSQGVTLQT